MGLRRLPNEQSLDELLQTIEETKQESIVGVTDDVFSFISAFNILPGTETVLKSAIYSLYKSWSKDPVSKYVFSVKIGKHLHTHVKGPRQFYLVNTNSMQIEKETLLLLEKNKRDKTKYPSWNKHFQSYLEFYGIQKGKVWVQSFVLMHFYDKWRYKNRKKSLLSEINFFNFCKLYFETKRNTESRMMWFGVNEEFVRNHLSPQKLSHLQQGREKRYGKKQKSKNKIPGFKTRAKPKKSI